MTEEPGQVAVESEADDDLVEAAEALIGTDALWRGQILYAAAELGVFERLGDDPLASTSLATELGADPDRTYRLLRALAHFGVLAESGDREFSVTPVGARFKADHPQSVQSDLMFNRSPAWIRSMLHLPEVVAEGGPPGFEREYGCEFFEYVEREAALGRRYDEMMELASRDHPGAVLDAIDVDDLPSGATVCDVGGGRGHFLSHLLVEATHLEGVVFDRSRVVDGEEPRWAERLGVGDRCRFVGGDMFDGVPEADAYFLKWILHNWDDGDCGRILSSLREAAPAEGRLFVIESLVPESGAQHYAKRLDVTMMTQVGGRERTEREYRDLLDRSGWCLRSIRCLGDGPMAVLEAGPR